MSTPSCHRPPLHAKFEPTRSARRLSVHRALSLSLLCLGALATLAAGQEMTGFDRQRAHLMLRAAEQDLRDHYYDTTFHGLDLRTLFDSTDARIAAAHSNDEAFLSIAVTLGALRDSHTHFFPPRRNAVVQYGWNLGIVGDSCYILKVRPENDAAAQRVKPGDLVLGVDQFAVNRADRWDLEYLYYALAPRATVRLTLQSPGDTVRSVVVQSKITPHPRIMDLTQGNDIWQLIREEQNWARANRSVLWELGSEVLVWRLPNFLADDREIDRWVKRAQGFKALVLDLRGNPGGLETTLLRLAGNLVGADTFGVRRTRDKTESLRTRPGPRFTGDPPVSSLSRTAGSRRRLPLKSPTALRGPGSWSSRERSRSGCFRRPILPSPAWTMPAPAGRPSASAATTTISSRCPTPSWGSPSATSPARASRRHC